eukprot:gene4010-14090_t
MIGNLLGLEKAAATARVEAHWAEVKRKQQSAAQLRGQIRDAESRLAQTRGRYSVAISERDKISTVPIRSHHTHRSRYVIAEYAKADLQVDSIYEEISRDEGLLPSAVPFLAQQALLPYPRSSVAEETAVEPYKTRVIDHYSGHQCGTYHTPSSTRTGDTGRVEVWTRYGVPQDVGPKHVDQLYSPSDGVWYTDSLAAEMCWKGSGSQHDKIGSLTTHFNPFANIKSKKKIDSFTERLQGTSKALQWCMPTYGTVKDTDPVRGNWAVAFQDERGSLSKPSYIALGNLRSYSFGQYRRLCAALCQKSLPLDHPVVRTAVMQSLYHLGKLYATANGQVGLKWRAHWHEPGDVLTTLRLELDRLADELEQTPREHDSVLLLGTISAYLSAWHGPCVLTTRRFARMVSLAADNEDVNIQEAALAGDDRMQQGLRERQSHLRKVSLLCYASGPFNDNNKAADAAHMIELMVLINHGCLFMEEQSEESKRESTHLHVRCQNIMALAVDALMGAVKFNPGCLTSVVRLVLPRAPETLEWKQLRPSASFEAEGADGHLYSINILDGTILLDGFPPSRLPKDIVAHHMYRRAFGDINFEMAKTSTGVLQTLKPVKGHIYNFSMVGGTLVVTEEVAGQGRHSSLELLDVGDVRTAPCTPWGAELPVRIRQLHSHWLCRARNIIVVRPISFLCHGTHFVICCNPKSEDSNQSNNGDVEKFRYSCLRIPLHLMSRPWLSLLSEHRAELTDELVLAQQSSLGLNILAKLEDSKFIHTYSQETSSLLWELPRYGLEFEQRGGTFLSRDYAGFKLADEQQLAHRTEVLPNVSVTVSKATDAALKEGKKKEYVALRCVDERPITVEKVAEREEKLIPSHPQ